MKKYPNREYNNAHLFKETELYTGADLGKKLRGDLYAGLYSKIGSK